MKKLPPFIIAFFWATHTFAKGDTSQLITPYDTATGKVTLTEVIAVDSLTKGQLFDKTLEWIAVVYKNPADVIKYSDRNEGRIIIRCFQSKVRPTIVYCNTITIDFKDNKCRIQVTNIADREYHASFTTDADVVYKEYNIEALVDQYHQHPKNKTNKDLLADILASIHNNINSLTAYLQKSAKSSW